MCAAVFTSRKAVLKSPICLALLSDSQKWPLGAQTEKKIPICWFILSLFCVCMSYITWFSILSESPLEKLCGAHQEQWEATMLLPLGQTSHLVSKSSCPHGTLQDSRGGREKRNATSSTTSIPPLPHLLQWPNSAATTSTIMVLEHHDGTRMEGTESLLRLVWVALCSYPPHVPLGLLFPFALRRRQVIKGEGPDLGSFMWWVRNRYFLKSPRNLWGLKRFVIYIRIKTLSSSYYLLGRIIINLWLKVISESSLN